MARHIVDYRALVILPRSSHLCLDYDGSGHFQVGRGQEDVGKTPLFGYFEPWNQQRFHPDEPFIDRVQATSGVVPANEAHFQHNVGWRP